MSNSSTDHDVEEMPIDPKRIRRFSIFFKRYMNVSSLVTAALPIPITYFKLIPTFSFHTKVLSVYTSLFCFLTLAFVFFSRHRFARLFFPERCTAYRYYKFQYFFVRMLPLLLILGSLACLLGYHYFLDELLMEILGSELRGVDSLEDPLTVRFATPRQSAILIGLYLGIFITAEAAFVLMAVKEYLQDVLSVTDIQLIDPYKHLQEYQH